MDFTPEQIEEIESLAGINYTVKQIAMYLNIPAGELYRQFEIKDSILRYHYDRGKLLSQAQVDMALLSSAKGSNQTAVQQLERVRQSRHFENMRDKVIYGD